MRYAIIDFETANANISTPCALGLCIVEDYKIVEKFEFYINPETMFSQINISIHGIRSSDILNAFTFIELWERIKIYLSESILVAHNASFDISVLINTLYRYDIDIPNFKYFCTLQASLKLKLPIPNNKLDTLCDYYSIELNNHHNALDDALACAKLFIEYLLTYGEELFTQYESDNISLNETSKNVEPANYKSVDLEYINLDDLNRLKNKNVVITGEIAGISRNNLTDLLKSYNCEVKRGTSRYTDYVIVGYEDLNAVSDKIFGKSAKILKAEALIEKGYDIKFIKGENISKLMEEKDAINI